MISIGLVSSVSLAFPLSLLAKPGLPDLTIRMIPPDNTPERILQFCADQKFSPDFLVISLEEAEDEGPMWSMVEELSHHHQLILLPGNSLLAASASHLIETDYLKNCAVVAQEHYAGALELMIQQETQAVTTH